MMHQFFQFRFGFILNLVNLNTFISDLDSVKQTTSDKSFQKKKKKTKEKGILEKFLVDVKKLGF